jgi:CelD/BcsL family acetyltransferase involved in cellulose biosynthesis
LGTRNLIRSDEIKLPFVVAGKTWLTFRLRGKILPRTLDPARVSLPEIAESIFPEGHDIALAVAMPVQQPLPRLSIAQRTVRYVTTQYQRHYIDLRSDVPGCFDRHSADARRTLRRRIRRFEEACGAQPFFREYKQPGDMPEFYALAQRVSQRTGNAHKTLPGHASFQNELIHLAEQDAVRGFILFKGETPVAFNLCRSVGDYLTGDRSGYDLEYAKWSPGSVLRYCLVKRLAEEGRFAFLDLGPGEASYKEAMATGRVLCANVFYFRNKVRYFAIVGLHLAFTVTARALVKLLDAVHLRERLRALLTPQSRPQTQVEQT